MKHSALVLLGLVTLGLVFQGQSAIAEHPEAASLTLAQLNRVDSSAPVGTLDPAQPIQIQVVNRSGVDTAIGAAMIQPSIEVRYAAPGEVVSFGRLHTSFLPPPLELEIYSRDPETSIEAVTILVRDNEIIVSAEAQPGTSGATRTVRVDETGETFLLETSLTNLDSLP